MTKLIHQPNSEEIFNRVLSLQIIVSLWLLHKNKYKMNNQTFY